MGKIVRNGIEFSSTSDTANNINYDNSQSGLSAVTAQEAIDEVNENVSELSSSLEQVRTYVGSDGKLHFVDASGADTALPFNKGVEIKTGTVSSNSYNYTSGVESVTFSTGVTGYTNGLAQVKFRFISGEGSAMGVQGTTSVNASTGKITFTLKDEGGTSVAGLQGSLSCSYIFWR